MAESTTAHDTMGNHTMSEQAEAMQNQQANNAVSSESEGEDSFADAFAAVALIAIFVFTCIYWISGQ